MILGVAGDLLVADEPRSHYLTKVGGSPWAPSTNGELKLYGHDWESSTACGACGHPMSLVLQAYAPLSPGEAQGNSCTERVLLVMGCAHPNCGTAAGSWRAFRCLINSSVQQLSREEQQTRGQAVFPAPPAPQSAGQESAPPKHNANTGSSSDIFGAGFDCDDGFGAGEGFDASCHSPGDGNLDFSDLGATLEECAVAQRQQQQRPPRHCAADSPACRSAAKSGVDYQPCESVQLPVLGPPLPEFHILAVEEPSSTGLQSQKEQEHVQRLLEEYERQEQESAGRRDATLGQTSRPEGGASGGGAGPPARRGSSGKDSLADSAGGSEGAAVASWAVREREADGEEEQEGEGRENVPDTWAGEEYEEDHVRGVQGAYLKFAARLARRPDQCARYARGGEVLWPLKEVPQPPACPLCGAARVFELQLVSPLIAMVLDCTNWLAQGPELENYRPAINAAANWGFSTVAIYTCVANCSHAGLATGTAAPLGCSRDCGGTLLVEEWVALVNEEQSHVPDELKLAK